MTPLIHEHTYQASFHSKKEGACMTCERAGLGRVEPLWNAAPSLMAPPPNRIEQAIVQDLLPVEDDLITFQSDGKGPKQEAKALLNDTDALWVEFRHQHIAKVRFGLDQTDWLGSFPLSTPPSIHPSKNQPTGPLID